MKTLQIGGGGQYITSDGYRMVKVKERFDCNSPWEAYKREHVLVMELFLKRNLNKDEIIHHIDMNKLNNDIKNLWLTSNKEHKLAHFSLERLATILYKNNFIYFDEELGKYEFTEELKILCKLI